MDRRNPERLAWLEKNRAVWKGKYLVDRNIENIHGMMQVAGLYKFSTVWYYSARNIRKMIRRLRRRDACATLLKKSQAGRLRHF
jgi:hypothetical protein